MKGVLGLNLWTPPWWGWSDGVYIWHAGYWGPHIGFYGGIDYRFGYFGHGYDGGYWDHGRFFYNREVNNIRNVNITNVYSKTVVNNGPVNRVAFNGGTGGIAAQPTAQEQTALHDRHVGPTVLQSQHFNAASSNRSLLATANNGQPKITATSRAGRFTNTGAVATTGPGTPGGHNFQSNVHTTNTGPTGSKGFSPSGPNGTHRTFQTYKGPTGLTGAQGKGPGGTPHVMSQTVRPAAHGPQGHPPPPPGGKNQNQKTPG